MNQNVVEEYVSLEERLRRVTNDIDPKMFPDEIICVFAALPIKDPGDLNSANLEIKTEALKRVFKFLIEKEYIESRIWSARKEGIFRRLFPQPSS